jgi:hypothetical protein
MLNLLRLREVAIKASRRLPLSGQRWESVA